MGKASKWIKNFLLGKKDEKIKKIDAFCPEDIKSSNTGSLIVSPKVKRRWSFGKLTGGRITSKIVGHKFSRSFDSGDSAKLQIQALMETKIPRRLPTPLARAYKDKNKAATKIQAGFRSYLARRALHALKGLVKIQALVRGHLVRKQTTATLRGMHALMAIQVRARIHRIQMAEEIHLLGKQPPQHREASHFRDLKTEQNEDSKDMSVEEMLEVLKSRSGPLDGSYVKARERDSMTFYSKHVPVVSKRKHQYKNTQIVEPNSPENYRAMSEFNTTTIALSTSLRHSVPHRQSLSPNYMNKTESSRAKARSQSEPKQRPKRGMRHKGKSVESPLNGPRQNLFSNSLRFDHGSLDHWVINFQGSLNDSKRDSFGSSSITTDSYY